MKKVILGLICTFSIANISCRGTDKKGGHENADLESSVSNKPARLLRAEKMDYCEFTWKQKPGYADYTLYDTTEKRVVKGIKSDGSARKFSDTLQDDGRIGHEDSRKSVLSQFGHPKEAGYSSATMCTNARIMKKCFVKAIEHDKNSAKGSREREFYDWLDKHNYSQMLFRMAISARETFLGGRLDDGNSGVGPMQVITAIDEKGSVLSNGDSRWTGITVNVLTNMEYSSRVFGDKVLISPSIPNIYHLAAAYNQGSYIPSGEYHSETVKYADDVKTLYEDLKKCGIE